MWIAFCGEKKKVLNKTNSVLLLILQTFEKTDEADYIEAVIS